MKIRIFLLTLALLTGSALAATPLEKFENAYPKNVGMFEFVRRIDLSPKRKGVMLEYKIHDKANARVLFIEPQSEKEAQELDLKTENAYSELAASDPAHSYIMQAGLPNSELSISCGPFFKQSNFIRKGRVYSPLVTHLFGVLYDKTVIQISVTHLEKMSDELLDRRFLESVRRSLSACK